jgi:capsule synthesis protein PGA_cap
VRRPAPSPPVAPPATPPVTDSAARAEAAAGIRRDSIERAAAAERAAGARAEAARRRSAIAADTVRVCLGGDVTLGTNLDTSWASQATKKMGRRVRAFPDPDALLAPLRPAVRDADVVIVNVEGAIGEGAAPRKCRTGSTNCYAFRQPPRTASALRRLAGDAEVVGNVANNHARDAGDAGLRATLEHLAAAGVHVTGADTLATVVVTRRGDTVAVLGFSTSGGPDPRDDAAVRRYVARAAERYPRVVVTMHMGAEGADAQRTRDTTELFLGLDRGNVVHFARSAVAAGADLVVGHGPHVVRGGEWRDGALVLYSLGNLLTYGPFTLRDPLDRGALACATLDGEGRVRRAALRTTHQVPPGIVRLDPSHRAAALVDSLARLDFPSSAVRVAADGMIEVPTVAADTVLAPSPRR